MASSQCLASPPQRSTDPEPTSGIRPALDSQDSTWIEGLPVVGDMIGGRYRVERLLGVGGMGAVLAAQHIQLQRTVAIKVLLPRATRSPGAAERFLREARAAAAIVGTHVASVTDAGQLDSGLPYLVMEHLTGETLAARLEAQGPLPIQEAVDYVLQACEGVAEAHSLGIVHRDLKPDNLFLHRAAGCAPFVKVLDFGVSKYTDPDAVQLTTSNMLIGSLSYMSPEQARNAKRVDKRTDVWALGVILYELVTGRVPFPGISLFDVLMSITADEPALPRLHRPDLPAGLEAVILRCLEKDLDRRVQSIAELVQALAPFGSATPVRYPLASVPPPADSTSSPPPPPVDDEPSSIRLRPIAKPRERRWPWLVLVTACAAGLAAVAALGASGWVTGDARAERAHHATAVVQQ